MASSMPNEEFEYSFEDLDLERLEVPEMDDAAVLMEQLERPQSVVAEDDDRLECVIRSLEAEVEPCKARSMTLESIDAHEDCEDCGLEEILSQLDSHHCSRSPYVVADPFDWGMEVGAESPCSDMRSWYVDTCMEAAGMAGYGDPLDYASLCYGEYCTMDQEYSPLWE